MKLGELLDKLTDTEDLDGDGEEHSEAAENSQVDVLVMDNNTGVDFQVHQVLIGPLSSDDPRMVVRLVTGDAIL